MKKRWGFHVCTPWNICGMDGFRLNIRTPWVFIIVPLNPAARVYDARWISIRKT